MNPHIHYWYNYILDHRTPGKRKDTIDERNLDRLSPHRLKKRSYYDKFSPSRKHSGSSSRSHKKKRERADSISSKKTTVPAPVEKEPPKYYRPWIDPRIHFEKNPDFIKKLGKL